MKIRSKSYRTDLLFMRFDGVVEDRGTYLAIRCPSNPNYFWGNFLLFSKPPEKGDCERWRALFAKEFACQPQSTHETFGWDAPEGERGVIEPFVEAGFAFEESRVLAARAVKTPRHPNDEVHIRPVVSDADWEQAIGNQVACRRSDFAAEPYESFKRGRMASHRRMVEAGRGTWFGAFAGDSLVADLGVFAEGDTGRFQDVGTAPSFRRRGICGTLVHEASRHAFDDFGVDEIVIVAEPGTDAARVYESLGYAPCELQLGLSRWDRLFWKEDQER